MPRNNVTVEIDTKVLDRLLKQMPGAVADNVRIVAFALEGRAKVRAPVDTGALRASIYTRMQKHDNFSDVSGDVRGRNNDAQMVQLPRPEDGMTAYVGPSVEYGVAVEFGTRQRGATPYLGPAVRDTEADMVKHMGDAIKDALK